MKTHDLIVPLILLPACQNASAIGAAERPEPAGGKDRPNILWLSFEDTSYYEIGCYGNPAATTPNIDLLASGGIMFTNAYSGGPQSSPSRSSLITGTYCGTYAMDWHRCKVDTPSDIFLPQYLRAAGYYCTNHQKTDYNTKVNHASIWNECSATASYNSPKRAPGQPFFAVFNCGVTHMSRLASVHTDGRRDFSKEGLGPEDLPLPPYVPDLPEVYSDYAFHVEGVNDVDLWVKVFLDDLKAKGLDDDTIIFVFSDHGGCLPRGKAFSYETTFRVPMVVYFPEKWKRLAQGYSIGKPTDRPVHFADFAPTVLSLAGVKIPGHMQGTAFFGDAAGAPRKYQYGIMANRTIHFAPARSVSDGKYKYIRYYIPYKKDALFNYFQWEMPANLYWDKAYFEGRLSDPALRRPYEYAPAESLYDLENDPFELNDLASDVSYAAEKERLSAELSSFIRSSGDIGFLPSSTRTASSPYIKVRTTGYDLEQLWSLAELTLKVSASDIPYLEKVAKSALPDEFKYWAAVNLGVLARAGVPGTAPALRLLMSSANEQLNQEAAAALCYAGFPDEGFAFMADHIKSTIGLEMLSLDPDMRPRFPAAVIDKLKEMSASFEKKARTEMPGQNDGICQRKVLVNLGLLDADQMYGPKVYEVGLKVNKTRLKIQPLP